MPKKSEKNLLIRDFNKILEQMAIDGQEDSIDFENLMEDLYLIETNRYLNDKSKSIPKSDFLKDELFNMPDLEFKDIVRMNKASFTIVYELIKENDIFKNNSLNKQEDVWFQLAVVLNRLGTEGTGSFVTVICLFI